MTSTTFQVTYPPLPMDNHSLIVNQVGTSWHFGCSLGLFVVVDSADSNDKCGRDPLGRLPASYAVLCVVNLADVIDGVDFFGLI